MTVVRAPRKIALIQLHDDGNYDAPSFLGTQMTDWREVSEEDFQVLKAWTDRHRYSGNQVWLLLEDTTQRDPTFDEILALAKEEQRKVQAAIATAEEGRKRAAAKAETTKLERKRRQFERLKAELGDQ